MSVLYKLWIMFTFDVHVTVYKHPQTHTHTQKTAYQDNFYDQPKLYSLGVVSHVVE